MYSTAVYVILRALGNDSAEVDESLQEDPVPEDALTDGDDDDTVATQPQERNEKEEKRVAGVGGARKRRKERSPA